MRFAKVVFIVAGFVAAFLKTPPDASGARSDSAPFLGPGIFEEVRKLGTYEGSK
jgi:hypothetical protein